MKSLEIIANRVLLKIKWNAPTVMIVGGVIIMGAACVMAAMASVDAGDDIEIHLEEAKHVRDRFEDRKSKEFKAEIIKVYRTTAWKMFRRYAPTVGVATAGACLILGGTNILNKRNAALIAAYEAVDSSFRKYRERVREEGGDELDRRYMYGENNNESFEVKQHDGRVDGYSEYARFFDSSSPEWCNDSNLNFTFLKAVEAEMNNQLAKKGHVFLNDVYRKIGLSDTSAGSVVGWVKDPVKGDGYISFGLFDPGEASRRFVNGLENVVLLDFNVDGVIYDLI